MIRRGLAWCACLLLTACATVPPLTSTTEAEQPGKDSTASADTDPVFPLTSEIDPSVPKRYRRDVELAQIEGYFLFREDRAAWVATDAAIAQGIFARHRALATGWLTEQQDVAGNSWSVAFVGKKDESSFAYADVNVNFSGTEPQLNVRENSPPRPLSVSEDVFVLARSAIASKNWLRCAETYNTSTQIFIDEGNKYVVVRMMPAWEDEHVQPMGGFHRFRIPIFENGSIEHFAQTKSCLDVDTAKLKPGEIFSMALLTSPTPTEFDVFVSLNYRRPHYVNAKSGTWLVEKGRISWIDKTPEDTP